MIARLAKTGRPILFSSGMSPWEDRTFLSILTRRIQRLPGRAGILSIRKYGWLWVC